jgi:hypothetical protein
VRRTREKKSLFLFLSFSFSFSFSFSLSLLSLFLSLPSSISFLSQTSYRQLWILLGNETTLECLGKAVVASYVSGKVNLRVVACCSTAFGRAHASLLVRFLLLSDF